MEAQSASGSFKAASEVSSQGGKELSEEQKRILFYSRIVMFLLLVIFIVCSLFEAARVFLCILLLVLMGVMSCCWEEDSYVATNDAGPVRRVRSVVCQFCMIIIPLGTAGWMALIYYVMITTKPLPELTPEELALVGGFPDL